MPMQIFGGVKEAYYGICASREWYKIKGRIKEKQRRAARAPNVVFVVTPHYQSLHIVVLLLQACLFGSLALSCTLCCNSCIGYNRTGRFDSSQVSSAVVWGQCCMLLEGKVEMFSQFHSCWKDGLATFLYSNFCSLGSSLHCSYWPFIKVM